MAASTDYIKNHPNDYYWYILSNNRLKVCQKIKQEWNNKFLFSKDRRIFDRYEDSIRIVTYEKVKLKEIQYLMDDPFNGGHHVFIFEKDYGDGNVLKLDLHDTWNGIFTKLFNNEDDAIKFCELSNNMLLYDISDLILYIDTIIKLEKYLV